MIYFGRKPIGSDKRDLAFREANMAGRKGRSVTFKIPYLLSLRELKAAIEEEIESGIIVFQDLGSGEFLLELETGADAESLIRRRI